MSNKHYARISADIEFGDGVVRTIHPLNIKKLREFVKIIEKIDTTREQGLDDDTVNAMVDASQIVLSSVDEKLATNREQVEEVIDMDVFQKLMTVAMGNRLADPNDPTAGENL